MNFFKWPNWLSLSCFGKSSMAGLLSLIFFALDEILKGTNSKDKSKGSWLFLEKVIKNVGTGLVATHDVSLGKSGKEYPGIVVNKCF